VCLENELAQSVGVKPAKEYVKVLKQRRKVEQDINDVIHVTENRSRKIFAGR